MPEKMNVTVTLTSTFYVTSKMLHALAWMHGAVNDGLSDYVLPDNSLSCIPCDIEYMGRPNCAIGTLGSNRLGTMKIGSSQR